ncbi:MAG TPA: methyltransferase domain-containing protein [Thermomonospora sp.]|nr:methyltransferase domain-containing protein [Thermomonospora sp.]
MAIDYTKFKESTRASFEAGDYAPIADRLAAAADRLVAACEAGPGRHLLDVGAGTGNAAVAAARTGATVTAVDLTPKLVRQGRERTRAAGLTVEWAEADMEDLPYEADRFDCVVAVFAANFAPRPSVAAAEMLRVLRPGGVLGLVNWTPTSFAAAMSEGLAKFGPAPDACDDFPKPFLWGDEETVRSLLAPAASPERVERHALAWHYPSPAAMWEEFERHGGPALAREAMPEEQFAELRRTVISLVTEHSEPEGDGVVLRNEYLMVVARKAPVH